MWISGGIPLGLFAALPLTVPCTALFDSRSVHRNSGGNGPRRHRLFERRNCADNQFHRNSLAVHFRNHVCNRRLHFSRDALATSRIKAHNFSA